LCIEGSAKKKSHGFLLIGYDQRANKQERNHMAKKQSIIGLAELKELMGGNADFLKPRATRIGMDIRHMKLVLNG
jgi:hypothetical protein